jgi:hypothetical protein
MLIADNQTTDSSLSALGTEAVRLLYSGDFATLVARFGYALASGREPAGAVREDLASCLTQLQSQGLAQSLGQPPTVRYFEQNDSGILAVVECLAPTLGGAEILVELVVTHDRGHNHVTLEQLSAAA